MKMKTWSGERLETHIYNNNTVEHLHRYAFANDLVAGKRVLDIACGDGYGSNLLADNAKIITGVDIAPEIVKQAALKYNKANLCFKVGSASAIPVEDGSIDVVVSFETIEHHDKHEEMLAEIKRVLVPGGILIMSSPDKENYSDIPKLINPHHVKELYFPEFKKLIRNYFKYADFLTQRAVTDSIIIRENKEMPFVEYGGDYKQLERTPDFLFIYNLCVASDNELPVYAQHSVFNAKKINEKILEENIIAVKASWRYRIGYWFLTPISLLKK